MKRENNRKVAFFAAIFFVSILIAKPAFADNSVSATSANWAGYIAQNGTYTGISGTWTMPAISYSSDVSSNATWVGIGGRNTSDLIQAGVYEIANSKGATYQAWYELLPDNSTPVNLDVHPGDSISVAILETSQNVWNIVISNNTSNQQFEKTVTYQSSLSSAEWIQERPLIDQSLATLSGFTPVQFSGATTIQNGQRVSLAQTGAVGINLLDSTTRTALAVPSAIDSTGTGFSVFRTSVISPPAPTTVPAPSIQYVIPPYELRRTGRGLSWGTLPGGITWVLHFPNVDK